MSQLNIFGEVIEDKKEQKKSEGKKKTVNTVPVSQKELPINRPLLVCYAGHKISVSLEERQQNQNIAKQLGKDELEVLRQKLEREFPELSESRVTWHWECEEDKNEQTEVAENSEPINGNEPLIIVPVVTAGKKG